VEPILRLAGVSRCYGQRVALTGVDLAVAAGECVAVVGGNGSGKSTLLRLAAGRGRPSTGAVLFGGGPISEDNPRVRSAVAYVGDTPGCYPDLSVREHLELVAVAHGAGRATGQLVDAALADCGLGEHASLPPAVLSGGLSQRLRLAATLVRPHRLLVLDEPEQRLDPDARQWLAGLIRRQTTSGCAVLLATHDPEIAATADRAVLLRAGRITATGRPGDLLTGPTPH
jgi:ABC-type multidrug transport system ATPase subunit